MIVNADDPTGKLTHLIQQAGHGDRAAEAEFCELVYDQLRQEARRLLGRGDRGSLQSAVLVNELLLRVLRRDELRDMRNRRYFFTAAVDQMRKILIDHARRRNALKRGGQLQRTPLDAALDQMLDQIENQSELDLEALHHALDVLRKHSPRQYEVVTLRFFGGRTMVEIAEMLGVALSSVERDWRLARAKLYCQLQGDDQ